MDKWTWDPHFSPRAVVELYTLDPWSWGMGYGLGGFDNSGKDSRKEGDGEG